MARTGFFAFLLLVAAPVRAASFEEIPALRAEAERMERQPPRGVPPGALTSILYLLQVAEEHQAEEPANARRYLGNAVRLLERARGGVDPFRDERGFVVRAYRSVTTLEIQPYSIYVPEAYDGRHARPMLVGLHGGASNHALYLGVAMGNGIPWWQYPTRHRDLFRPKWQTDSFIVAVEGLGHAMYRWMAERDVFDVIKDAGAHYAVDQDRITINGLSNGGVGCYGLGARYAWRWNAVVCASAAPSWILYSGQGGLSDADRHLMSQYGALEQAENLSNTTLEFFHGRRDPGPMRPMYARIFDQRLTALGIAHVFNDIAHLGHDLITYVHDSGELERRVAKVRRNRRPERIRLVAYDLRGARQHWLEVTGFERYGVRASANARVARDGKVAVETQNVASLAIHVPDVPAPRGDLRLVVDGDAVVLEQGGLGLLRRSGGRWRADSGRPPEGLRKRPGLAGPLTDAYFDATVFTFGTKDGAARSKLERAARFAANGWPLWLHGYRAPVMPEDEVTDQLLKTKNVVVIGTPETSSLVERLGSRLPIRLERGAVVLRGRRLTAPDVGVRMIYPNVLAGGGRYVVVQSGTTVAAAIAGNKLPDFVPDWVVYDGRTTATRPRLAFGRQRPIDSGFFDADWRLP
ncbi:MAG: hypothetical protein HYY06_32320 [Deltaproteobacteria bacterium]|nr:hypothetical protein [Deltaproteobacteria bacterium]